MRCNAPAAVAPSVPISGEAWQMRRTQSRNTLRRAALRVARSPNGNKLYSARRGGRGGAGPWPGRGQAVFGKLAATSISRSAMPHGVPSHLERGPGQAGESDMAPF